MSRLDELKKQYPQLNMSFFDMLVRMDRSNSYKYMPLLCKIFSKRLDISHMYGKHDITRAKKEIFERLDDKSISTKDLNESQAFALTQLTDYWTNDTFTIFKDFMYHMENNKLVNKDVTSYKDLDEMQMAISIASINEMDKMLSKQVFNEFEDETWIAIRPLTFQSSAKYGAGTKWCTTFQKEKQYFERYWRTGVLVYFINKKTGYKFAMYKSLDEKEITFWNAQDNRIDFMDLNIEDYLYPIIKKISKSELSNKHLSSDDIQTIVHKECLGEMDLKEMSIPQIEMNLPSEGVVINLQYDNNVLGINNEAPSIPRIEMDLPTEELRRIFEAETLDGPNNIMSQYYSEIGETIDNNV